jgi:hypothetical protein
MTKIHGRASVDPIPIEEGTNLAYGALKAVKKGELVNIVDEWIAETIRPESLREYGEIVGNALLRTASPYILWALE